MPELDEREYMAEPDGEDQAAADESRKRQVRREIGIVVGVLVYLIWIAQSSLNSGVNSLLLPLIGGGGLTLLLLVLVRNMRDSTVELTGWRRHRFKALAVLLALILAAIIYPKYQVHQQQAQAQAEAKKQALAVARAQAEARREAVSNSGWDGSVWQAERAIKARLRDPDSFKAQSWGRVVKTQNPPGYMVWCTFRARNGFGGYNLETWVVAMDRAGNVTGMEQQ